MSMRYIGRAFTILKTVDSTNNYAMAQVHAGLAKHGNTYFALEQTAGKGQRGKTWLASAGENILMSVVFEAGSLLSAQFLFSVAISLGCYDVIKAYAGEDTTIKWPNDIYWRDRKAGGILIEPMVKGNTWQFAVAGIGLNINQTNFPGNVTNPVSLKQITGRSFDVIVLAKELCGYLENRFSRFQNTGNTDLLEEYNAVLFKRNAHVTLKQQNRFFKTLIKGVNSQGNLVTYHGIEQEYTWGEVEWVL